MPDTHKMADKDAFEDFSDESSVEENVEQTDSDYDSDVIRKLHPKLAPVTTKDAEEEELERLVLGSKASFREQLFKNDALGDLDLLERERQAQLDKPADEPGLEGISDADLFFVDTITAPGEKTTPSKKTEPAAAQDDNAPAWEDSDDERLTVSLAGVSQLRKLRISADEDVVSGSEYARRLRKQFLVLNPLPKWAKESEGRPAKRRRRSSAAASDSSISSDEAGDDDLSAAPLEKLLRDVGRLAGRGEGKKKKLRPEVIDIQRTRPIPEIGRAHV